MLCIDGHRKHGTHVGVKRQENERFGYRVYRSLVFLFSKDKTYWILVLDAQHYEVVFKHFKRLAIKCMIFFFNPPLK